MLRKCLKCNYQEPVSIDLIEKLSWNSAYLFAQLDMSHVYNQTFLVPRSFTFIHKLCIVTCLILNINTFYLTSSRNLRINSSPSVCKHTMCEKKRTKIFHHVLTLKPSHSTWLPFLWIGTGYPSVPINHRKKNSYYSNNPTRFYKYTKTFHLKQKQSIFSSTN